MISFATPPKTKVAPWKWWVVVLMLLATVVNYIDRQTLGSAENASSALHEFLVTRVGAAADAVRATDA